MESFRLPSRPEYTSRCHRFSCWFFRPAILILLVILLMGMMSVNAMAASVTLAWDPNDPPPDGYMLLIRVEGATYNYDAPVWVGATSRCLLDGLVPGTTYYMVVRAYVGADQSGDSNEIQYTPATATTAAAYSALSDQPAGGVAVGDKGADASGNVPGVTNLRVTP